MGWGLITTPAVEAKIQLQNLNPFNLFAFITTLFIWVLSCVVDPKKYFNLATLIATGFICYLSFWFMFEVLMKL